MWVIARLAGPAPKEDAKAQAKASGPSLTFDQFHTELFSIATGWLAWSPSDAWAATPAEILAARDGRIAMLKMIFGSSDTQAPAANENLTLDEQAMAVFGGRRRKAS